MGLAPSHSSDLVSSERCLLAVPSKVPFPRQSLSVTVYSSISPGAGDTSRTYVVQFVHFYGPCGPRGGMCIPGEHECTWKRTPSFLPAPGSQGSNPGIRPDWRKKQAPRRLFPSWAPRGRRCAASLSRCPLRVQVLQFARLKRERIGLDASLQLQAFTML